MDHCHSRDLNGCLWLFIGYRHSYNYMTSSRAGASVREWHYGLLRLRQVGKTTNRYSFKQVFDFHESSSHGRCRMGWANAVT